MESDGKVHNLDGPPIDALRAVIGEFGDSQTDLPFAGGFVGYFAYDFVHLVEKLPFDPRRDSSAMR